MPLSRRDEMRFLGAELNDDRVRLGSVGKMRPECGAESSSEATPKPMRRGKGVAKVQQPDLKVLKAS